MACLLVQGHAALAQNSHTLPLVLPSVSAGLEGFVRIVNRSNQAGSMHITAFDCFGDRYGPATFALTAWKTPIVLPAPGSSASRKRSRGCGSILR